MTRRPCSLSSLPSPWIALAACATLSACAYDPPKPGVHTAYGEPRADITCVFEAPTASNFVAKRCRRTVDMDAEGEVARETADAFKTPVPSIR